MGDSTHVADDATANITAKGSDIEEKARERGMVSFRRGDTIALWAGIVFTLLLVGYLVWASARNFSRDQALIASDVAHTH